MNSQKSQSNNDKAVVNDLEKRIKNNQFKNKEQLFDEMVKLRNSGVGAALDNRKMRELLNLFDSVQKKEDLPLDMKNYKSGEFNDNKLIISKEADRVLTTSEGQVSLVEEFKQKQNEIMANNKDGISNADDVFENMAKYQKGEMSLISIIDAVLLDNISLELLDKIKFFIANSNLNPNIIKIDIKSEVFYNIETNETYEVRDSEDTNEYKIYKDNIKITDINSPKKIENEDDNKLEYEQEPEPMEYESNLYKPKTRVRKKDNHSHMGNAAFTKIGFLIINIITVSLLATMAILLYK